MRKLVFTLLLLLTLTLDAQVKFLGIPVDGTKSNMVSKLEKKGFTYHYDSYHKVDFLTGMFNGKEVILSINDYHNKVWRIKLFEKGDAYIGKNAIKQEFNELVKQFENNKNYIAFDDQYLNDEFDVDYEISTNDKQVQAGFYQIKDIDTFEIEEDGFVWFLIAKAGDCFKIILHYDNQSNKPKGEDL